MLYILVEKPNFYTASSFYIFIIFVPIFQCPYGQEANISAS